MIEKDKIVGFCPSADFEKLFWQVNLVDGLLQGWRANIDRFPHLHQLDRKYLAFMPSSALSEKLWSRTGAIWTPKRNQFDSKSVAAISCLSMMYAMAKSKDCLHNQTYQDYLKWVTSDVESIVPLDHQPLHNSPPPAEVGPQKAPPIIISQQLCSFK
mmetsp:Transcript_20430/g.30382  ORF Transcript_20430/g.30382 Transcript_20430/m.30382 type:complete len:157 (-) Transcript_20430:307-777(-)